MKKEEIIENKSNFKAVNAFIFGGSFSIGTMKAGFDLQKVLEIADSQPEQNAFYFIKNVEDVPVILPSTWENDTYLDSMKNENIDLMCCNCPCSSLSQINRHASVDGKNNVHFYRLFNIFKHVQPKAFVIENAPTLIKLGLPILKDLVKQLGDLYRFTIIRDYAGNHGVAMRRQRTLVVGWSRTAFSAIPQVEIDKQPKMTAKKLLEDIYSDTTNDHKSETSDGLSELYKFAYPNQPFMASLAKRCISEPLTSGVEIRKVVDSTKYKYELDRLIEKMNSGHNYWDKSPFRPAEDGLFPSLTSVTEYLHPVQNRTLNMKELSRIMNYPDWYDFSDPDKKCKIPVTQAIAQGVPANFGKYIAMQVRKALEGKLENIDNADVVFQNNIQGRYSIYSANDFLNASELDCSHGSKAI